MYNVVQMAFTRILLAAVFVSDVGVARMTVASDADATPAPPVKEKRESEAGHRRMVALLHQIAQDRSTQHPYFVTLQP